MTREEILLTQLGEECNEVAQRISKALRFGLDEVYPKSGLSNAEGITQEMNDLLGVWRMLVKEGVVPSTDREAILAKEPRVEKYMRYSKDLGRLDG